MYTVFQFVSPPVFLFVLMEKKKKVKANPFLPKDIILPDKQMITTKDKQMITSSQVGPIFIPLSVMITPLVLGFKILHWL